MFCPKCGSSLDESTQICSVCGFDFSSLPQKEAANETVNQVVIENSVSAPIVNNAPPKAKIPIIPIIYIGLAVVILIMFFSAAGNISESGNEIMQIQSVGGTTLEEAYYAELGVIYSGYALICKALGIFLAAVLVWLGLKK